MKSKARSKKLSLKKVTITNLHNEALLNIKGGVDFTLTACPSSPHTGCISFCASEVPCDLMASWEIYNGCEMTLIC